MTGHMEIDIVGHTAADTAVRMVRMAADSAFPLY